MAGAFRGYGCPQGFFALESHVDEIATALGDDPLEFRTRNHVQEGDDQPIAEVLGEGKEGFKQIIRSCGLPQAIQLGSKAIGWADKRRRYGAGSGSNFDGSETIDLAMHRTKGQRRAARAAGFPPDASAAGPAAAPTPDPIRRGVGMAIVMQASGIPGVDMGAASIKMNEDASFNLLVGATDIGTGADTMFCQLAAEALGVPVEKIIPYSSDTDMTPFDPGAYASSTTYISGRAVEKAARAVREQITAVGARMLEEKPEDLVLHAQKVCAKDGRFVTYEQVCLSSLYQKDQFQIMATASHMSYESPPPFAAVFVEVEVDTETGAVRVLKVVEAVDCGQVVNPHMAEGQIEGAAIQSVGYALYERMPFDASGRMQFRSFRDYTIASRRTSRRGPSGPRPSPRSRSTGPPPPSPTRSSMPSGCACARSRSRRTGSWPRSAPRRARCPDHYPHQCRTRSWSAKRRARSPRETRRTSGMRPASGRPRSTRSSATTYTAAPRPMRAMTSRSISGAVRTSRAPKRRPRASWPGTA